MTALTHKAWWRGMEPNRMEKNDGVELGCGVEYYRSRALFLSGETPNRPIVLVILLPENIKSEILCRSVPTPCRSRFTNTSKHN